MHKYAEEWLNQAKYDIETALVMRRSGRNVYAVLMCHMAVEKALKGLVHQATNTVPPKTHSLVLLLNKAGKKPEAEIGKFLVQLDDASVATRYPEELGKLISTYTDEITDSIMAQSEKAILWIKKQF
jgi:HEPN domain-containing protein